jgi:hypothetical protein
MAETSVVALLGQEQTRSHFLVRRDGANPTFRLDVDRKRARAVA